MLRRVALALICAVGLMGPAAAQNIEPYVYALTISTASVQVLPANQNRKQVEFHNPNATALVAVCPVGPARSSGGGTITAAINGPGCITILPYDRVVINSGAALGSPQSIQGVAWVGIANTAGSGLTVLEWE